MQTSETSPGGEQEIRNVKEGVFEHYLGFRAQHFLLALGGVVVVAFYVGNLLFGNASLEVLLQLETYEGHLTREITRLKQENAALQKEFFELKELEPSE